MSAAVQKAARRLTRVSGLRSPVSGHARTGVRSPKSGVLLATSLAISLLQAVGAAQGTGEKIVEIRVHGNHTTPDADVLMLSGLAIGQAATDDRLRGADRSLRASGRFSDVEIRRRYLSIADPSQILIMIVIDEKPAVTSDDLTPGPMKRIRAAGMWLPILNYADGYGLTYGARITFVDPLGPRTRVSVPLSWGGERRAGVDLERSFGGTPVARGLTGKSQTMLTDVKPPVLRLRGSLSAYRRVNPFFDVPDSRREARVRAEHPFASWLRAGASARTARVDFGGGSDAILPGSILHTIERHDAVGADVVVDTRLDPSFPRNAIHAIAGWEHLGFAGGSARRWNADLRGYVGAIGSTVIALRSQFALANAPLPLSERPLLGGGDTLRGYRAGHRAGDNLAAFSIEARVPINSPLSFGRFGVKGFVDTGTTWLSGMRMGDQKFERGIGGGVYFGATAFIADLDVAWPESGGPRAHFGLGVSF